MMQETGCDHVMIGRAAMTNPFIFTQINEYLTTGRYREISATEKIEVFFRYLEYAKNYPTIRFVNMRMQAMNFTKGIIGGKNLRAKIAKAKSVEELKEILGSIK